MEQEGMVQIIGVFSMLQDYLSPLTVPAASAIIALMEWLKNWDKKNEYKKWYLYIGLGSSIIASIIITLLGGYGWAPLLLHFIFIYFGEVSVSMGFVKPIVKFALKILKKSPKKQILKK